MANGNPVAIAKYNELVKKGAIATPVTKRDGFLQLLDEYRTTTDPETKRILAAKFAHDTNIPSRNQSEFISTLDELSKAEAAGDAARAAQLQARLDKLTYLKNGDSEVADSTDFGAFSQIINDRMRQWEQKNPYHTDAEYQAALAGNWFKLGNEAGVPELYEYGSELRKNLPIGAKNEAAAKLNKLMSRINSLRIQADATEQAGGDASTLRREMSQLQGQADIQRGIAVGQERATDLGGGLHQSGITGQIYNVDDVKASVNSALTDSSQVVADVDKSLTQSRNFSSVSKGLANSRRALDSTWFSTGLTDTVLSMLPWTDNAEAERFKELMKGSNFLEAFNKIREEEGGIGALSNAESEMIVNMMGLISTTGMDEEAKITAMRDTMTNILSGRLSAAQSNVKAVQQEIGRIDNVLGNDALRLTDEQRRGLAANRDKLIDTRNKQETTAQILDYQAAVIDEIGAPQDFGIDNPLWPTYEKIEGVNISPITRSELVREYGEDVLLKYKADAVKDTRLESSGVLFNVDTPEGETAVWAHSFRDLKSELKKLGVIQ
jgi:hypothetical protein